MSLVRALRIRLGSVDVGILFDLEDGRVYFQFDEAYAFNPSRPILSVALIGASEEETRSQLVRPPEAFGFGGGSRRLPVYFRNLLPEGILRKQLVADAGIEPDDELALLAYCGEDLPGDITAVHESLDDIRMGRLLTGGHDSYEFSSHQLPTPQAVSLSGVQPKVDLVAGPGGRYVMRSKVGNNGPHFIGKLPASDYEGLPEVEHLSMKLAQAAGVQAAEAELRPLQQIADKLPFTLRDDARNFLLVRRFDRDAPTPTRRLHMEDFAQALSLSPEQKYDADYATIGLVLLLVSVNGAEDALELLRRIKVNELLGNYDAHAKNFSILFGTDGQPRLSPAYDIVAYAAYLDGHGHALRIDRDQNKRRTLTPATLRQLANIWDISEKRLANELRETVARAVETWPDMISASAMTERQKLRLSGHFERHPDVVARRRRHPET
jgi:serine/threonine-protein kinase HipA